MRPVGDLSGKKMLLSGSQAAAYAAKDARVEVVTTHPIVPETAIVEQLCDFCSQGDLRTRLVRVESAHSALATLIGASAAGARSFTATSSQGLALMHEMLHWAAGDRLPIVVANVNRALGAPWSIWVDHNDSLSQRDTGWMQFYASSSQEVYDLILLAFKIGEIVQLPALVNLDGFYLSHTIEPLVLPDQGEVDAFLPPYQTEWKLDTLRPRSIGNLTSPDYYIEFRYRIQQSMDMAKKVAETAWHEYAELFGRRYSSIESYETEDADIVFIAYATMAQTVKHTVREMRREGKKVGLIRVRMFRPFPVEELCRAVTPGCRYVVLDRNVSFGSGGIFCQEIRGALYGQKECLEIHGVTLGLGGRDITPLTIRGTADRLVQGKAPLPDDFWEGVRL
jgi:pyruvate/2-oxoacid:ferredoxin oxidoreductase alpha subunit